MSQELEELTFEEALKELEMAVERLQTGELSLDESLALFERGQKLAEHCNSLLEKASLKVEMLTGEGEIIEWDS